MIRSHHEMHRCGTSFKVFAVNGDGSGMLQSSEYFSMEHSSGEGTNTPFLKHLDQSICE